MSELKLGQIIETEQFRDATTPPPLPFAELLRLVNEERIRLPGEEMKEVVGRIYSKNQAAVIDRLCAWAHAGGVDELRDLIGQLDQQDHDLGINSESVKAAVSAGRASLAMLDGQKPTNEN